MEEDPTMIQYLSSNTREEKDLPTRKFFTIKVNEGVGRWHIFYIFI